MRIYTASSEETLRARKLLTDWAGEGLLTEEQYKHCEQETVSELRTTSIFLRLVLFLFTVVGVGAAVALFLEVSSSRPRGQAVGVFFLIVAAACYAAAEVAVSRFRLYRFGIEEALAMCSVGFLCAGLQMVLVGRSPFLGEAYGAQLLIPASGAILSLWIWRRFGLWYAFLCAMSFVLSLPGYWTSSHAAQHSILAVFYAAGLLCVAAVRNRHRFDYLNDAYSLAEALLWLGIYLAINLKLFSLGQLAEWSGRSGNAAEVGRSFYWTTWVLIWCLPPVVLARGIRQKDRFVLGVGAIAAILTLVSNKPYLGWPQHTWDPMLLGILLTGVALFIRRWLSGGPEGIRHGFTAARLSGNDKHWMSGGSAVLGLVSPQSITPSPEANSPEFHFGGGASGGGGASSDF